MLVLAINVRLKIIFKDKSSIEKRQNKFSEFFKVFRVLPSTKAVKTTLTVPTAEQQLRDLGKLSFLSAEL